MRLPSIASPAKWFLVLAANLALAGCEQVFRGMYDQPKLKAAATSPLFADGQASRLPPPGSLPVTIGEAAANSSGQRGAAPLARLDAADAESALPADVDVALLARGRERYTIYCAPCHGATGAGDGAVVRRGFPAPPPYRSERLRMATDRHFYDVVAQGYGVMPAYADRIDASDRWAIVAHVRRLQTEAVAPVTGTASPVQATPRPPR
jgi:mono/diheme cytochrome c family protein